MTFTQEQAERIAKVIDQALRDTGHPDLPEGPIRFALLIQAADGTVHSPAGPKEVRSDTPQQTAPATSMAGD